MNKFEKLRAYMAENEVDGVLITSLENMQWYSGFSGDTGDILVTAEAQYFMTDFRYLEMAEREMGDDFEFVKITQDGAYREAAELIKKHGIKKLGIETSKVTLDQKAAMDAAFSVSYCSIDDEMHALRTIKTPEEIGQELKEELKKREISNRAEAAEAEKMHKKALEEEKKRQLEEAAKALEEKHGDSKFKPTIMTYNDVTKTATPYEPENRDDDDEPAADPQDRDDDMPSEEELAVYDTDYLNADDEDSSEEEHDAEDHSSDEEK